MNVEVDAPVEKYLAAVRAALTDLPAAEVAEIADDVRGHLVDVRTEVGADADLTALIARLGTPEAYAAELRAAAGYPAPAARGGSGSGTALLALSGLVVATLLGAVAGVLLFDGTGLAVLVLAGLAAALGLPALLAGDARMHAVVELSAARRILAARPGSGSPTGRVAAFVASLQPAWWLLRALVAAMLVGLVIGRGGSFEWTTLTLTLVFGAMSIWLGHRSRTDRRWWWLVVPLNAFAAALVLTGWPGWASVAGYVSYSDSAVAVPPAYLPGLWQDGERQITDVRPVDVSGRPLSGVYLFDQNGRPIDTGGACTGYGGFGSVDRAVPYPRGTAEHDPETGECTVVPPGPLVVVVPTAEPTPTPFTSPPEPVDPSPPTSQPPPTR